jgi:hypothetical protein
MLDRKSPSVVDQQSISKDGGEQRRRVIQRIFYYIKSVQCGHKYIWQSLPRALELWFDQKECDDVKIHTYMKQEL